ncbi:MAG TPA: hypothetical protein VJ552_10300 [Sediminibacterium sp.]|nr:hypothetical protein [Sediminibacterium sp.]
MNNRKDINEELDAIAPLLKSISRLPVQSVPEGYFEQFSVKIPAESAPVVKMPMVRKWMGYASAALVAGILVTAGFIFTDKNVQPFNYEQYSRIDVPVEMNKLTDDELQNYLVTATVLSGAGHTSSSVSEEINETITAETASLNQVSDEELEQFLNENAGNTDLK